MKSSSPRCLDVLGLSLAHLVLLVLVGVVAKEKGAVLLVVAIIVVVEGADLGQER